MSKQVKSNITAADVGKTLYTTDGKDIYWLKYFKPEPQVSMINSISGVERAGNLSEFKNWVRLLPEVKPPGAEKRTYRHRQVINELNLPKVGEIKSPEDYTKATRVKVKPTDIILSEAAGTVIGKHCSKCGMVTTREVDGKYLCILCQDKEGEHEQN